MLLDAYALIAYLGGEAAADEVEALLRDPHDPAVISAANVSEVVDRLARVAGLNLTAILKQLVHLRTDGLEILTMDAFDGACSGSFRQKFYDRRSAQLSMGDCFALAAALRYRHRVATSDQALATTAESLGLGVVALPDSTGRRPELS